MITRRLTTFVVALALGGILAAPAAAQQVGPGGPNAQVGEYVSPEISGGEQQPPGLAGDDTVTGTTEQVGAAGQVPFTGLVILPLAMLGIVLVLGGLALRRRRSGLAPAS